MLLERILHWYVESCKSQRRGLRSSRIVRRRFGNSHTMLLCRRLRRWHGASFPSSVGSPVLLGLLEFSDWQLVQVLAEACHLVSSQPFIVILNWFLHLTRCSFRSSGRLLITHAIVSLVPMLYFSWYFDLFLRFSEPQWPSLASWSPQRTPG